MVKTKNKSHTSPGPPFLAESSIFHVSNCWYGKFFFLYDYLFLSLSKKLYKLILFELNRIHYIRCQDSNFKVNINIQFPSYNSTNRKREEKKVKDTVKPTPTPPLHSRTPPTGSCGDIMQQMLFTINLSLHLMNYN